MQEIIYLSFTILVEASIAILLLRREKWQWVLLAAVVMNLVSALIGKLV
ncbi:MAG: hypothetical protein Q7S66_05020 [bacterium]|nr:hypothetical protein [bacterium]